MMDYMKLAYAADIEIRMNGGEMEAEWADIKATVGMANEELLQQNTPAAQRAQIILNHHTPTEDAAKVFNETAPKHAVFNHMVIVSTDPKFAKPTQEQIFERTREYGYEGPLEIARDLMTFETIRVVPFNG